MVEKQQNILKNKLQSNTLGGDFEKKSIKKSLRAFFVFLFI